MKSLTIKTILAGLLLSSMSPIFANDYFKIFAGFGVATLASAAATWWASKTYRQPAYEKGKVAVEEQQKFVENLEEVRKQRYDYKKADDVKGQINKLSLNDDNKKALTDALGTCHAEQKAHEHREAARKDYPGQPTGLADREAADTIFNRAYNKSKEELNSELRNRSFSRDHDGEWWPVLGAITTTILGGFTWAALHDYVMMPKVSSIRSYGR